MRLTIPTNFDDDFFDKIDFSHVTEIYGKMPADAVGGGRAAVNFFDIPKAKFVEHVKEVRKRGISFNYLLNATCMNNWELTRQGHRHIRKLLDFVCELGADIVTVALPQLVELIHTHYPQLKISISTNVMVNNMERVRSWEELGVDQITLSYSDVNRDFGELKRIVKHAKCEVQTICNLICRKSCPYQTLHGNYHSHASQKFNNEGFAIDYYCNTCIVRFFRNPVEVIRSGWIRPEDLHHYEAIGIDKFKLVERGITTEHLANIVGAYSNRSYDGNFMDLLPSMSKYKTIDEFKISHGIKHFLKPHKVNVRAMMKIVGDVKKIKENKDFYCNLGIYMDNKKLDGFLKHFIEKSCRETFCDDCAYCATWAKKAIVKKEFNGDFANPEEVIQKLTSSFANGDVF